ncbi:hypothetical protein C1G87_1438 [Dehalococcoides mccartyi]|uniref:Uncharacterized protein n=1 Tax=Dehalococcoides mccartyi TaxID=61435 RepID=A0A328EMY6_9CHLR|nr:hypothetical protein C1G87_1438 [Dehalococcoides mccartyi]
MDYNKPTTEIDWNKASRFDFRHLPSASGKGRGKRRPGLTLGMVMVLQTD